MTSGRYLEDRILSADPVELIHIVYQHALDMVIDARRHLAAGEVTERSRSISRAISAVSELDSSLDHAHGGQISKNLGDLYQYMRTRLTAANLMQQDAPLAEVESLLATLDEAWSALRTLPAAPVAEATVPSPSKSASWGAMFPEPPLELAHGWSA
jgi:flagellar protein FliS